MKRAGAARRDALVRLCPAASLVVDVGADHGHVAHALGAVATERRPHRSGRGDVPWVVADGLAPFRHVPVAVIAGMGAHTIAGILTRGPRPDVLVAHAQDDPPWLRRWLAANGWRIDAEALAPEAGRFAEVVRAVPGASDADGLTLAYGPRLLEGDDPHLRAHLLHTWRYTRRLHDATNGRDPARHATLGDHAAFLADHLARRGWLP
ncbi:MAG: tRNA (adenine(22)-N(1))-methyltransferase TrmK [Alphaproteobacteria bacterium]|nr:tRNA (adenine(22)-N(1))-methyltransferase TrmK [Alphaproteobacteria bacterium]